MEVNEKSRCFGDNIEKAEGAHNFPKLSVLAFVPLSQLQAIRSAEACLQGSFGREWLISGVQTARELNCNSKGVKKS